MANVLQSAKQFFQNKFQDDEGWFRQGKFTPAKQIQPAIQDWQKKPSNVIGKKIWDVEINPFNKANWNVPLRQVPRQVALPVQSFAKSFSFGLAGPSKPLTPQTTGEKLLSGAGTVGGLFTPGSAMTGFGIAGRAGRSAVTKRLASTAPKFLSKVGPLVGEELAQTALAGSLMTAQGRKFNTAGDLATGIALNVGLGAAGRLAGNAVSGFRVNPKTMDEIIKSEDMIKNPLKYVDTEGFRTLKNKKIITKKEAKKVQALALSNLDRISAKFLPNDVLKEVSGNPKKMVKALVDLNSQNKLTNVSYLTDQSKGVGEGKLTKLKTSVTQEQKINKATADTAKVIREAFTPDQIKDINKVKTITRSRAFAGGDIETLRSGKNTEVVNRVVEFVRDKRPDLVGDAEALDFALNLPTKAETVAKRPANIKQLRELLARQAEDQKNWDGEFGKVVSELSGQSEADKSLFAGTMTPKQYSNLQSKRNKSREAFNKRTLNESLSADGGYRAYKSGKTPATKGLPTQELLKSRKDKTPFSFQRETIKRNIEDVFGRKSAMNEFITGNLTKNELNATKQRNTIRQQITGMSNKYQIKRGSKADKASADFIEGNISKDQIKKQFGTKAKGIVALAEEGRKTYKTLLEQINAEITQYGYEPIKERSNYVTHTKQILGLGDQIGSFLNLKQGELPRAMAAINVDVKPGKKFFGFGLERKGGATHEGLLVSMDKYLNSATRQIHHTSDIQRGRAVLDLLQKSGETDKTMSNFTSYFGQYVDSIAGKQNIIDRPFEKVIGRKVMAMGDWARKRTGANMVGGNISSALTNFIPFTQSLSTTNKLAAGEGLIDAATNVSKRPSIIDGTESGFLARRFPTERMGKDTWSSIKDGAGFLFKTVDKFTATSVVAGKYREGLQKGLSKLDAMKGADDYAARVLADRTFGQSPLLFNSRVLGALTQFQLEVNNQVSFLTKDIPKNLDFNKGQAISALIQFTLYSYLLNEFYEKATGRRPQIDPIYMALTAQGLTPEGEGQDFAGKGRAIVSQARQGIPFASEGRLPVGSALPDVGALIKGESDLMTELKKPAYYIAPPLGGGQIKKTVEGLQAGQRGYSETKSGLARFPVKPSIKTAIFGQWSTPEAREYFAKKQRPLGKTQTAFLKQTGDKQGFFKTIQAKRVEAQELTKVKEQIKETGETTTVGSKVVYYDEPSNEVRTLDYGKIKKMPSQTRVDKIKKDKETYSFVKSIMGSSLSEGEKNKLISEVGVSNQDAQYYSLASESVDVRTASVYDMLDGVKSREQMLQMLENGRREVNGDMVVTNPIIDDLYDDNLITYAEKKYLKSIKQNKLGQMTTGRASGSGKKPPKPTFKKHTAPRVAKVKLPPQSSSIASKTKSLKLKVNLKRTMPRVRLKTK